MIITWDQLIDDYEWEGGNIENHIGGDIYRGGISVLDLDGNIFKVYINWFAKFNPDLPSRWQKEKWPTESPIAEACTSLFYPRILEDGGISIEARRFTLATLYPSGSDKLLDSLQISGLTD